MCAFFFEALTYCRVKLLLTCRQSLIVKLLLTVELLLITMMCLLINNVVL